MLQTSAAIVSGDHPVTKSEAIGFAALHCQILYGPYNPDKQKPGAIE